MFRVTIEKTIKNAAIEKNPGKCRCLPDQKKSSNYKVNNYLLVHTEVDDRNTTEVYDNTLNCIFSFPGYITCCCRDDIWVTSAIGDKYYCQGQNIHRKSNILTYYSPISGRAIHRSEDATFIFWLGEFGVEQNVKGIPQQYGAPTFTLQVFKKFTPTEAEPEPEPEPVPEPQLDPIIDVTPEEFQMPESINLSYIVKFVDRKFDKLIDMQKKLHDAYRQGTSSFVKL